MQEHGREDTPEIIMSRNGRAYLGAKIVQHILIYTAQVAYTATLRTENKHDRVDRYVNGDQDVGDEAWVLAHPETGANHAALHVGAVPVWYLVSIDAGRRSPPHTRRWSISHRSGCPVAVVAGSAHGFNGREHILEGAAVGETGRARTGQTRVVIMPGDAQQVGAHGVSIGIGRVLGNHGFQVLHGAVVAA